ncbi:MAG TPA: glycogen debranching protein GlgX [Roseiflexaceae bacterium]|nr:glycogen debranching protein GlgX [Roseiflexaceae bacterium]
MHPSTCDDVLPGRSHPLGATVQTDGVNFCVFSRNCTAMELLLFNRADDPAPARVIQLDPARNRTFYYWHAFVRGITAGQLYGYRADGPFLPETGLRFDREKVLIDPYARAVMYGANYSRAAACRPGDTCATSMKSVVVDPRGYDWEGDAPLRRPEGGAVIYELHVGGFTRHPSSGLAPALRGTYAGLIEQIPYLQSLGVTAVELLPVQQFDPQDAPPGLTNYWGYSPIAFFAPHRGYSARQDPLGPVNEFRDMVKALHRAGIEVILDVVFNHTAEGDQRGPTLSFRGLENRAYYILDPADRARYANYSGTGNTIQGNHSIVRRMIVDCLHHWVQVMHVDGFRFDLASVFAREGDRLLADPPILWEIESDPVLAGTRIIAEAWDAAGLYQVGSFVGHRWAEWNGLFRDDVRRFIKSDPGMVGRLAARLSGSRDIYRAPDRTPDRSVNFVTSHDGFTLNDLVSYNQKHNVANGEGNRDGMDANDSWNCGAEGPSDDPQVEALRARQVRNFLTVLLVAQGTPMLLMGDEVRRTQGGNNNAYAQDNPISWLDWGDAARHADLLRFVRGLIGFRRAHALFTERAFWGEPGGARISWHGVQLGRPDWSAASRSLAFELQAQEGDEHLYVILNAYWEPLRFELPPLHASAWRRVVDTSRPPPEDFVAPELAPPVPAPHYAAGPRSAVVLTARPTAF